MLQSIQKNMMKKKNKKGFTLVEVIVVLVILAILAAILVPSMIGWINKANEKTAVVEARSILLATQEVVTENYKTADATLQTDIAVAAPGTGVAKDVYTLAEVGSPASITAITISGHKVTGFTYDTEDGNYTVTYTKADGYKTVKK